VEYQERPPACLSRIARSTGLNPTQIVPKDPDPSGWLTPHHREQLDGRPFGDGTPPGPPHASRPATT
jgi:hypothetical protein